MIKCKLIEYIDSSNKVNHLLTYESILDDFKVYFKQLKLIFIIYCMVLTLLKIVDYIN